MAGYTQDNRPIRVDSSLGRDVLLLDSFHGVEGVSMPFAFHLDLLSEKADIDALAMLRTPMFVTFEQPGGGQRFIHGLVRRFVQLGQNGPLTAYHAEVVPWLWFLSLSRECRVYQNMGVLDIVEKVFKDRGWADFEIRCNRPPPPRDYCVQYRETHLNFIARLLEEEGIHYFFEHTDEKHVLVLSDDSLSAAAGATPSARFHRQRVQEEDVVWSLEREHAVHVGAITLRDYDYLQPSLTLENTLAGQWPEEVFDYPGKYTTLDDGYRYARLLLEAQEAFQQTLRGESNGRGFTPGFKFELTEHYRPDTNGEYLLLRLQHFMKGSDYLARGASPSVEYHNDFLAIPADIPFRPQRRTPRPVIYGTQTALVVGPAGEEVHVDSHCRVKIQFYWDREGQKDENSSCWVRVSTPWGGKGYGGVSIPRIGNEVVIEFLEGDPDRPLVVGSVYNAEQTPPFALPGSGIQMGMKSRSSPGGGGFNEITMTDTKGKEAITIHGQYDMTTTIEHDNTRTVLNNETISISVDQTNDIGANRTTTIGTNEAITIGADRTVDVGKSETLTVGLNRTRSVTVNESVSVGAAQEITVGGVRAVSVGANQSTTIGANHSVNVGSNQTTSVSSNRSAQVGKDDTLKVGKKLNVQAGDEISLTTGKASIVMKKDGSITISGKDIAIKASGKIDVKASKDITMKGKKILQN